MTRPLLYLVSFIVVVLVVHGQIEYVDPPETTAYGTCDVNCCIGCMDETLIFASKTVRKCTVKARPQSYVKECGYMGTSYCTRYRTSTYRDCTNVILTYNKVKVGCRSGCTCLDGKVLGATKMT